MGMAKGNKKKEKVLNVAKVYLRRKNRVEHPDGKFDYCGRWNPAKEEKCKYCGTVRRPSTGWPYTLSQHCRTAKHIAAKHGVTKKEVLQAAKQLEAEGFEG
jgi:hypothetical protein